MKQIQNNYLFCKHTLGLVMEKNTARIYLGEG